MICGCLYLIISVVPYEFELQGELEDCSLSVFCSLSWLSVNLSHFQQTSLTNHQVYSTVLTILICVLYFQVCMVGTYLKNVFKCFIKEENIKMIYIIYMHVNNSNALVYRFRIVVIFSGTMASGPEWGCHHQWFEMILNLRETWVKHVWWTSETSPKQFLWGSGLE